MYKFVLLSSMFSYLGLGLMAARTSILQLGNDVKDCKWFFRYRYIVSLVPGNIHSPPPPPPVKGHWKF